MSIIPIKFKQSVQIAISEFETTRYNTKSKSLTKLFIFICCYAIGHLVLFNNFRMILVVVANITKLDIVFSRIGYHENSK